MINFSISLQIYHQKCSVHKTTDSRHIAVICEIVIFFVPLRAVNKHLNILNYERKQQTWH